MNDKTEVDRLAALLANNFEPPDSPLAVAEVEPGRKPAELDADELAAEKARLDALAESL